MASVCREGISRRFALLIGPDPHGYGLARTLAIHLEGEGISLGIFADKSDTAQLDAALSSIGVEAP
jgi:hypothetical protein